MPKISVNPLATRNSSSPYWTAFRHWTRNIAKSIEVARCDRRRPITVAPGRRAQRIARVLLHPAAWRRIGERLDRDAFDPVLVADDLAQVDVLHRIVRLRQRERPARAVDMCAFDRGDELLAPGDIALHRGESRVQHLRGVITLHGVHVG